jgi:AbrB family looped-hinge helix DNA binding protein
MQPVERPHPDVTLRPKRQITLPAEICEALGLQVGDRLELSVSNNALVVKPKKALALEALREIQSAFAASGVSEQELQDEADESESSYPAPAMARNRSRPFVNTNVLFSGLYNARGTPAAILRQHTQGGISMVISRQVLDDLIATIRAEKPDLLPALQTFLVNAPPEICADPTLDEVA